MKHFKCIDAVKVMQDDVHEDNVLSLDEWSHG